MQNILSKIKNEIKSEFLKNEKNNTIKLKILEDTKQIKKYKRLMQDGRVHSRIFQKKFLAVLYLCNDEIIFSFFIFLYKRRQMKKTHVWVLNKEYNILKKQRLSDVVKNKNELVNIGFTTFYEKTNKKIFFIRNMLHIVDVIKQKLSLTILFEVRGSVLLSDQMIARNTIALERMHKNENNKLLGLTYPSSVPIEKYGIKYKYKCLDDTYSITSWGKVFIS